VIAVITGATEGIGKQTAIELGKRGFHVVVHGRSEARAKEAAKAISGADVCVADFASLKQVRAMAADLAKRFPRIDVLLNNAGVYAKTRTLTEDGFELTVGVNHFAHFVLTHMLVDSLRASDQGRVVNVASGVHGGGEIDFDDLGLERGFSGYAAYANSKLMNVLFSSELARRLQNTHITSNALHPGVIATKLLREGFGGGGANVDTGARTTVMVASDPSLAKKTGAYFSDEHEVPASATARDPKLAKKFYEKSCALTDTTPLPESS
jgi:NAD(P)-dependent dehydrogenase (short-subunit alcohol dehydrogenase family)